MKLHFEQQAIAGPLYEELGFRQYLSLFDRHLPILPSRILQPLTAIEGLAHFQLLAELKIRLDEDTVTHILDLAADLPHLDTLLPRLENGQLEQYHLFELGHFLQAELVLQRREADLGLPLPASPDLAAMQGLLARRTRGNFSLICLSEGEERLRQGIEQSEAELAAALLDFEDQIQRQTGLKMTYPWPREIALSEDLLGRISACGLLAVQPCRDLWRLDFRPTPRIEALVVRRDRLTTEFETLMQTALSELNSELAPFFKTFAEHYQFRRQRIWHYLLIATMNEHGLCLPHCSAEPGCRLEQAFLHPLRLRKGERCIPLDLDLATGASVLYGANMSGKTTVLKTLFFILSLIRFGLPVPATAIQTGFPEHVLLLLKSPGDISRDISSYGEELAFLARPIPDGAIVLVDELFSSTDPLNGAILSEIFLGEFNRRPLIFFCTSHYPQVLDLAGINLFRMADIDPRQLPKDLADIRTLQEHMPYRIERLLEAEQRQQLQVNHTPLEIALLFALPPPLRQRIEAYLKTPSAEY